MKSSINQSFRLRLPPTIFLLSIFVPFDVFAFSFSAHQIIPRFTGGNTLRLDRDDAFRHRIRDLHNYKRKYINANSALHSLQQNTDDNRQNTDDEAIAEDIGENVSVTIQRSLPNIAPREARDAWIEYHWKKGGGLPIYIFTEENGDSVPLDDSAATAAKKQQVLQRTILPIFMKERAAFDDKSLPDENSIGIQYEVTESGPLFADLIPGSHSAAVKFDGTSSGTTMTWKVDFATTRLVSLYEAVTKFTVGTAATTVQEAASTPRLFSAKTTIDTSDLLTPEDARSVCLDFVFAEGGGLPLLPPIPFGEVLPEGGGSAKENLIRIPPLLTESVIGTKSLDSGVEFTYQLNDPGVLTTPFLVHTHLGRVRFSTNDSSHLLIDWDVEIRPYKIASPVVEKLVEMTVSTILRNLRVRLTQPDAVVNIQPPRGNTELMIGDAKSFGSVAKDTWLGGVLDAHLFDKRSAMDQTLSLLQPWTWGRSGTGGESDDVQFQWTDGSKISS